MPIKSEPCYVLCTIDKRGPRPGVRKHILSMTGRPLCEGADSVWATRPQPLTSSVLSMTGQPTCELCRAEVSA